MTGGTRRSTRRTTFARKRKRKSSFAVDSNIAREIWAVGYLAIAIIFLMSVYGGFGIIGELLNAALQPIFGFGIHLVPILFLVVSATLFFSKKIHFGISSIVGLALMMVSLLSIFHLSVPTDDLLSAAQTGTYGGYIGFVTNFLFREVLKIGHLGTSVLLIAGLSIGFLFTFELSIITLFKKALPSISMRPARKKSGKSDAKGKKDEEEFEDNYDEDELEDGVEDDEEIQIIKPEPVKAEDAEGVDVEDAKTDDTAKKKPKGGIIRRGSHKKDADDLGIKTPIVSKKDTDGWEFPSLDMLSKMSSVNEEDDEILKSNAEKIRNKLEQFGIYVTMSDVHVGPTVVQYTLKPDEGVKLAKITTLKSDLALALSAKSIRIEAPIPGKGLVGIEVPNSHRSTVRIREMLESKEFSKINSKMRFPLGRDVSGKAIIADIQKMPHLLIAGATGSGKSVGINALLMSLLYQNSPQDLRLILIDPKRVELNTYNGIPHLLTPVITDVEKAATSLRWAVNEMNRRYQVFQDTRNRNIHEYNNDKKIEEKLPKIIILIDELADMMMAVGKEVEATICRIAQMSRATGIHLVIATQRPSVDIITGLIKANIPTRIAFATTSGIDSRTILDGIGAEDLLGQGDMLYLPSDMSKPIRIQGTFASTDEINKVTNFIKLKNEPNYDETITSRSTRSQRLVGIPSSAAVSDDELYKNALNVVMESRKASASLLQRRLQIGYARAARLLDEMEENGIIGPVNGAKPRNIFIDNLESIGVEDDSPKGAAMGISDDETRME